MSVEATSYATLLQVRTAEEEVHNSYADKYAWLDLSRRHTISQDKAHKWQTLAQGGQEGGQGMRGGGVVDGQQVGQGNVGAGGQRHVLGDGALQLGRHPARHVGDLVRVHQHAPPHLRQ